MDTESKLNDDDIGKIVKQVACQLNENVYKEDTKSLDFLRRISGNCGCDCISYTPRQKLSMLLKLMQNNVTDYSVGLSIIDNYECLALEKHCHRALQNILTQSLNDPASERKYKFLDQLWCYQGLTKFQIDLIEDFIYKESKYIEEDIFEMFDRVLVAGEESEEVWKEDRFARLVSWSCASGKVFSAVTSVLNSWLQRVVCATDQHTACLAVVKSFIANVKLQCSLNKRDFVFLYPREYHSLISLLDIDRELFTRTLCQSMVVDFVRQSLSEKPVQTICILTHFPDWAKLISEDK